MYESTLDCSLTLARAKSALFSTVRANESQMWFFFFSPDNSDSVRQGVQDGADFVRARDIVFFVLYVFPLKWERLIKNDIFKTFILFTKTTLFEKSTLQKVKLRRDFLREGIK